jgi:hypothetical protein
MKSRYSVTSPDDPRRLAFHADGVTNPQLTSQFNAGDHGMGKEVANDAYLDFRHSAYPPDRVHLLSIIAQARMTARLLLNDAGHVGGTASHRSDH